jgi:hypothetical protein
VTAVNFRASLDEIRERHGSDSLARLDEMLRSPRRNPTGLRGGRWLLPGLPERPWHDPAEYGGIAVLAEQLGQAHGAVKAEFAAARRNPDLFATYPHFLGGKEDWRTAPLFHRGTAVEQAEDLFPATVSVLEQSAASTGLLCPLLESHFSILEPGCHISPHSDLWNFSINFHFAVVVPDGDCAIEVAGERREWIEGQSLLFDYSYQHEAWNRTTSERVCLLADLWHPGVSAAEREALTVLVGLFRGRDEA